MGENRRPITLRDGSVFIDGVKVLDACKIKIVYTPEVWEGKYLGDKGTNRRWIGRDITGSLTEYKSTNWLREKINEYEKTGKTPEMTIQGIREDPGSDYYDTLGDERVTAMGVVLTGDIPLIELDTDGDVVKEEISFGAKRIA